MKDYMFKKNLSVKQLAGDLDISTSYLYQLIRGERKPSIELAQKIEEYTGGEVTLGMLLGIEDDESSKIIDPSLEAQTNDHIRRFSSIESAHKSIKERLGEIEGRLLKLERRE